MNIAIIIQGTGRYLFKVPEGIVLKQGETVKCDTVRGITDGTVWADSLNVEEPAAKLIGSLFGAKFPLKSVVGKTVTSVEMFEQPEQPKQEDKPKFKVGDKVKVVNNTCGHFARIGDVITLKDNDVSCEENAWHYTETAGYITERDFEPYVEPKQEPVKLYCVKSYRQGEWFTEGRIYETNERDLFTADSGYHPSGREWRDNYRIGTGTRWSDFLVPLVSRPANVGEWVYVLNKSGSSYEPYKIYKVFATGNPSCVWFADDCKGNIKEKDYLVLDGYKPEATTAPEPIPEKSMRELVDECCNIGMCSASGSNRKADCPLRIAHGECTAYAKAHPEMRQTLEAYLENERKPEEPIKPEYYTGKVVCVNNGSHPHFWTAGKVYEVTNGKMFTDTGEAFQSKATCPEELKPNNDAVFIEFMEG